MYGGSRTGSLDRAPRGAANTGAAFGRASD